MKEQKGITLIALIITIIVMLILVGVSVTVALNGGLFSTAKDAADRYEAEKVNEEKMATEEYIQGIIDGIGSSEEPTDPEEPGDTVYTLSGEWEWEESPLSTLESKEEEEEFISQDISFTITYGLYDEEYGEFVRNETISFTGISVVYEDIDGVYASLYYNEIEDYIYSEYDGWLGSPENTYDDNGIYLVCNEGWSELAMDFGTEPQEVSQEFYAWFTANANPVE